jgi:beta-galactosidase
MRFELCFLLTLLVLLAVRATADPVQSDYRIDAIPTGYHLYAYDDCGVVGRQPHIDLADCYNFTFATSDTDDADLKQRSAVFSYKEIRINYADLDPKLSYALALTYASDHVYKRVQSLWAGDTQLHPPIPLPSAKAIQVIVKVPESAVRDGKLALTIKIHGEVNATASIIELWSSGPPKNTLRMTSVAGTLGGLTGRVVDLKNDGVKDAQIKLFAAGKNELLATTTTAKDGTFNFDEKLWKTTAANTDFRIEASSGGEEMTATVPASELGFEPVRYRPMPVKTQGLEKNELDLNGPWKINPHLEPVEGAADDVRKRALTDKGWSDFHVPGQWLQQGFDVAQDKPVAMAREFTIPQAWAGYRIILRFDAIHAGTNYLLNGKKLGYSENLFTPVEWDITDAALVGKVNRLDLEMTVATASERLSYSSGYAFHSLGGIDRAVRLYALPQVHIRDMRLLTDLDSSYKDGEVKLSTTLDSHKQADLLALHFSLLGPDGKPAKLSTSSTDIGSVEGSKAVDATIRVTNPLKWTAEKPNLYKLVIELRNGQDVIERVERSIGFRKIEIRDKQVYINGKRVKFAGACHHEFDPLTGRADAMHHAVEDVKLLKEANLNYLRTSHYPPTQELLDAADRLGVYVECEAPFCWVQATEDLSDLKPVLTATSAMIDYCHTHPSIIVWSMANESSFNKTFEFSDKLAKQLDPTRLTTFNNPDPNKICDIVNWHYPPMPFDEVGKDDPRPLFLGEYWFPVCHEQTDVSIDPGLRELWGHGHADPTSDWAKMCDASFNAPTLLPGERPGAWSHIAHSDRVIGGAIWAEIDEPFYFKDGKHVGYAWHHGFWGLIDAWRRPKPEWWLAKMIFSPVWFPVRQVAFAPGQDAVSVPVENRYSFTDLKELNFAWELGTKKGKASASVAPGATGQIKIPIPAGTAQGDKITLRVTNKDGDLINVLKIALGAQKHPALPQPTAGLPKTKSDGWTVQIEGKGFSVVLDQSAGEIAASDPRHKARMISFPMLHITRHDYGDLNGPKSAPYEILPDAKTHVLESCTTAEKGSALEIAIKDHYDHFAGSMIWLIDKNGVGKVSYDYTYTGGATAPALERGAVAPRTGDNIDAREVGISALLHRDCDTLKWNRWSEWDVFPADSISRTEGTAKARRPANQPDVPEITPPTWPWALDQTELGTNDFRSVKFCIYDASLTAPDGSGVRVNANADAHFRACLDKDGVKMHILKNCPLGPLVIKSGDRLKGEFIVTLLGGTKG